MIGNKINSMVNTIRWRRVRREFRRKGRRETFESFITKSFGFSGQIRIRGRNSSFDETDKGFIVRILG